MFLSLEDELMRNRLRLLTICRVCILTLLLGIAIYIDWKSTELHVSTKTINIFYLTIAAAYVFSAFYIFLIKFLDKVKINIYLQAVVDLLLITALVYMTGSLRSIYSVLYTLIIIYSAVLLGRKGSLIVASLAGIFYGLLVDFEFYKMIPSLSESEYGYGFAPGDIIIRILIHLVSFYILAFLASYVVEQEKRTRSLLKERESAFNQLDLLFSSIIESVDTGVMTLDLNSLIKSFNRAAEEITEITFSQVKNRSIQSVFPEFLPLLAMENPTGKVRKRKEVIIEAGNGNKTLGCSISPLKDKKSAIIGNILIFQDLTEIKKMEQKLEQQKRLALIGEMAAGLAHEMRNPLASITGSIELLRQGLKLEETDERLMQIILRSRDQLDNFVRDYLMLARPIPATREPVNISEMIKDVIENLQLAPDWNKMVKINMDIDNKAAALANREEVRQIIRNLILNSLQAMADGGDLFVGTKLATREDAIEYVEIEVRDTGCGIEAKDLKNIFEPFFTSKERGTGLGLTIVNRIVDGYGGKIMVESLVGQGATCKVWLKVAVNQDKKQASVEVA